MTISLSSSGLSNTGDVKPENWSNSSIKLSLSTTLSAGLWVAGSSSLINKVSITLWMVLLKLDFHVGCLISSFPKMHFIASILTDKSLPDIIGWDTWNEGFL